MSTEEQTFDKLRQLPIDKMLDMLGDIEKPSPIYSLGHSAHPRTDYYSDIQFHLERIKLLEDHGWKYEDFLLALEKRSILEQIKDFNDNNQFPSELVNRAKRFFPNAKFTQASIELE